MSILNRMHSFFDGLDTFFWGYVGLFLILSLGLYLSIKLNFFQLFKIKRISYEFFKANKNSSDKGIHPLKIFFSSVGGMVGIGNVVGIITAVQIGGPGALFWVWLAAPLGAIIKYSEIFLGMKYRKETKKGFEGGPMYFLKVAMKYKTVPIIVAVLLCIYGVEIYQFNVICDSLSQNLAINKQIIVFFLLSIVLYACKGGIKRVAKICSVMMPFFMVVYSGMCFYIIFKNISFIKDIFSLVFQSAFSGSAAVGGFVGSSVILVIKEGISRAVYSGDIGIGYDSIINSQSSNKSYHSQAMLSILGIFVDNLICTLSILVVLLSSMWQMGTSIEGTELIQLAFSSYFPFMKVFMPAFILITGYSTIIAYFAVGIKCAKFLSEKNGAKIYYLYAICSLIFFSYFSQTTPLLVMSLAGAGLISINLIGIFLLRDKISSPFCKKAIKEADKEAHLVEEN